MTESGTSFTAVRRSGVLEMYMHGKLAGTTSGTARNISYTSTGNPPPLTIGAKNTGDSAWVDGSAALIRISATAPTAEQIAKIYEDEKGSIPREFTSYSLRNVR
jgi:trimeric autotransporter adhesin